LRPYPSLTKGANEFHGVFGDAMKRCARARVCDISATPSSWKNALMCTSSASAILLNVAIGGLTKPFSMRDSRALERPVLSATIARVKSLATRRLWISAPTYLSSTMGDPG